MSQRVFIAGKGTITTWVPTVLPWLIKMAKWTHGRRTVDDIMLRLLDGRCDLWVTMTPDGKPNGALVSTIEVYPRMKMLHILHCAGEIGHMDGFESELYDAYDGFARHNGCAGVEFTGRPGWEKYVKQHGYRDKSITYEKFFEGVPS